jgi:GT2 family glycosyltransferase
MQSYCRSKIPEKLHIRVATVAYWTASDVIGAFLDSIRLAAMRCQEYFPNAVIEIFIVDNSRSGQDAPRLGSLALAGLGTLVPFRVLSGHGNVGYGAGLNRALVRCGSYISIASNPDIVVEPEALQAIVSVFRSHRRAGVLTPCFLRDRRQTHLCKRLPSVAAIVARQLPSSLQAPFRSLLDHYEMCDRPAASNWWNPPCASGAFLAFRTEVLDAIGGFDEGYFLYFEDFDISLRARRITDLLYTPEVRVTHTKGQGSKKGRFLPVTQARSALRFWSQHGFRLLTWDQLPKPNFNEDRQSRIGQV